jgi:tetratricopeptide (TPR) repeat protein
LIKASVRRDTLTSPSSASDPMSVDRRKPPGDQNTRMLNKYLLASVLFLSPLQALAQGGAPTRVATETTPEQEAIIRAGIDLHDEGQFDQAIAKYQEVLGKSPSNVTALFEMAYSYLSKKDFDKSLETARKGAEFKSELLPMFYDVMASSLDGKGQPQQAIEIYKKGIALVPDASQLYYNMAVTYRESLGSPDDARLALQKAASIEPMHPGVQLLLGQVYQSTGYTTPAFLALSTFLVLDAGGNQALPGYGLWRALLKGGVDPIPDSAPSGPAMRGAAPKRAAKTDQGDFSALEAQLVPTHTAFMRKLDAGTPEIQALIAQVDQLLGALPAQPAGPAANSFVNTHYVPFFVALKQKNFVEPFVYWASQRAPVPGVTDWLRGNEPRLREFLEWAGKYSWPKS